MNEKHPQKAIWLWVTPSKMATGANGCYFGGLPTLPEQIDWPHFGDGISEQIVPDAFRVLLHFVAQIDLKELPQGDGYPVMPGSGTLFCFMDPVFAPHLGYYNGGVRVIYLDADVSNVPERSLPPGLPILSNDPMNHEVSSAYSKTRSSVYARWPFIPTPFNRRGDPNFWEELDEKRVSVDPDKLGPERTSIDCHSMFFEPDEGPHLGYPYSGATNALYKQSKVLPLLMLEENNNIAFGLSYLAIWITADDLANARFDRVLLRSFRRYP